MPKLFMKARIDDFSKGSPIAKDWVITENGKIIIPNVYLNSINDISIIMPTIEDGKLIIAGKDTGVRTDGKTIINEGEITKPENNIIVNIIIDTKTGNWIIIKKNGNAFLIIGSSNGPLAANSATEQTPHIDMASKHWVVGEVDTGILAIGSTAKNGIKPQLNPTTKRWMIGDIDTGVTSEKESGLVPDFVNKVEIETSNKNDGISPMADAVPLDDVVPVATEIDVSSVPKEINFMCTENAEKIIYPRTVLAAIDDVNTIIPSIGENGNWFIGDVDTEIQARGIDGVNAVTPHIDPESKHWMIGEEDTGIVAEAVNGITPSINPETKTWMFGEEDTGIKAEAVDGKDAITPHIDPDTRHWVVGDTDTGILAEGKDGIDGTDGVSPTIDPDTKHWMLGDIDTGISAEGQNGRDGIDGVDGKDGIIPSINPETKHWMVGETDTGIIAEGQKGETGLAPHIDPETKHWMIGDFDTNVPAEGAGVGPTGPAGKDGATPSIDPETKHWVIGEADTGILAEGQNGQDGKDGLIPSINPDTKTWMIGDTDTGIKAEGQKGADGTDGKDGIDGEPGKDGVTPSINPENKHWMVGDTDTGISAEGQKGEAGLTPSIDPDTKHWMIGDVDTGILAEAVITGNDGTAIKGDKGEPGEKGEKGDPGEAGVDGITPHIDPDSKHWVIGEEDTGIVAEGQNGQDGTDGKDGADGITPSIDPDTKHWMIGDTDTGIVAEGTSSGSSEKGEKGEPGEKGEKGDPGEAGVDGITPSIDAESKHWMLGETDTGVVAEGQNGITPHIDSETKHWMIGEEDTGIVAEGVVTGGDGTTIKGDKGDPGEKGEKGEPGEKGEAGADGQDGITPSIDSDTKHWMIGETDTGIVAEGQDGADGITPSIDPDTKHWMLGETDTGVVAEGQSGGNVADFTINDVSADEDGNYTLTASDLDIDLTPYATKENPTFTGNVVVPDLTAGDNSTKAANSKFVTNAISDAKNNPTFTGTVTVPDNEANNDSTNAANTKYVDAAVKVTDDKVEEILTEAPEDLKTFKAVGDKLDTKANMVTPEAENNIAVLNKDGDLADGGLTIAEILAKITSGGSSSGDSSGSGTTTNIYNPTNAHTVKVPIADWVENGTDAEGHFWYRADVTVEDMVASDTVLVIGATQPTAEFFYDHARSLIVTSDKKFTMYANDIPKEELTIVYIVFPEAPAKEETPDEGATE